MLSKEAALLLMDLVSKNVRIAPDGTSRADQVFKDFQSAMRELASVVAAGEEKDGDAENI